MTHIGHSEKVLFMRVFIAVLVLIFSLQSWTKADDIRDFEIEGISIGDSLLEHFPRELIEKENLVDKADKTGNYLLNRLYALQEQYPNLVSNARGRGLYCAFDLPSGDKRDKLAELLLEEGSILLGSGHQSIRFRPHLNVKTEDIDFGIDCFKKALDKLG